MILSIDTNEKTITVQGTVMINELLSKLNGLVTDWYNYRLVQTEQPIPQIKTNNGTALLPYTTKSNIFC